jgi:hypothetical protein
MPVLPGDARSRPQPAAAWAAGPGRRPGPPRRGRAGVILAASVSALALGLALVVAAVAVLRAGRDEAPSAPGVDPLTGRPAAARNGVEEGTADQIWHAVQAAVRQASSVRVTGSTLLELPDPDRWWLDLSFSRQGDAKGLYRNEKGDTIEVRRVGGRLYVRSAWLFRTWGRKAVERIGDRWILVPPQVLREVGQVDPPGGGLPFADSPEELIRIMLTWSFNNYLGVDAMADDEGGLLGNDPERPAPLRERPGLSVVGGRPAVAVEQGGMYLLVAASGPPYPLERAPIPGSGVVSGDWRYGWNAPVQVAAPAGAVDLVDVKP